MKFLTCNKVSHTYGGAGSATAALDDVSFGLGIGRVGVLIGPSGCGKTTLLNLFAGFFKPSQGRLLVDGNPIERASPDRMVVFQDHALFAWMTVEENIMEGMYSRTDMTKREKRQRSRELISRVHLDGFADSYPVQLSGGMRQRAGLARALAPKPLVLLLDEPFGALDAITREQLQDELAEILQASDVTSLLVTHSIDEAVFLGDEVFIMSPRPGRLHETWLPPIDGPKNRSEPEYLSAVAELRAIFSKLSPPSKRNPQPGLVRH